MRAQPVILVFDVGKTNKKIVLFDQQYHLVHEESVHLNEVTDEDNFPCENLEALIHFVQSSFEKILSKKEFNIRACNFSGYGASFVCVDDKGKTVAPLYNYLKPYPEDLREKFYEAYGGSEAFCQRTASPLLGSLNSGMQLYRLKYEKPQVFASIVHALHLPQFLSFVLTGRSVSEITSIGCHTNLWDFRNSNYHEWVNREGILSRFPEIVPGDTCVEVRYHGQSVCVGVGLHDSSAALIPYLASYHEPFVLLSTGTWCISLNPFNNTPLTSDELKNDCLCYLTHQGKPVKASRLFAGHEHDQQLKRLTEHFHISPDQFTDLSFEETLNGGLSAGTLSEKLRTQEEMKSFDQIDLHQFPSHREAYLGLMLDIIQKQVTSTKLVLAGSRVKRIFVDGGFSRNSIYMNLLNVAFPEIEVSAASVPQASALGAALIMHRHWNERPLPSNLMDLKRYSMKTKAV